MKAARSELKHKAEWTLQIAVKSVAVFPKGTNDGETGLICRWTWIIHCRQAV